MTAVNLRQGPFVLLDDSRPPHLAGRSLLFHSPREIVTAHTFDEVGSALERIDALQQEGLHLAGWTAYECAAYFEPRLREVITTTAHEPLVWMMATEHRLELTPHELTDIFLQARRGNGRASNLSFGTSRETRDSYGEALARIHNYIEAGDVYQINHTFELPATLDGDFLALYEDLRRNQPVPYGALIDTGDWRVLSLSPELFVERKGRTLMSRPMKGTAPRGRTNDEDATQANFLRTDAKSRAENLMIVDLIRNDLSRVALPASVDVPALFEVERYPTLHQMTSTVTAETKDDLTPSQLLAALFPCGSVTGAPKVRALEIISELEKSPRGIYCGAIGHFGPRAASRDAHWCLNVPIRTIVLDDTGKGRMNVGSGVVADSNTENEYDECLLKARFAQQAAEDFSLIETMKLDTSGSYHMLDAHLHRLKASAAYFNFHVDDEGLNEALKDHAAAFEAHDLPRRVRVLSGPRGSVSVTSTPLPVALPEPLQVCLAKERVSSRDAFLAHKTTNRRQYDGAYARAFQAGYADILFFNERDELTEGAISTVFVVCDGHWYTPPLEAGVLPGILRSALLGDSDHKIEVRPISRAMLLSAQTIYIGNSVRGLREVTLDPLEI